VRSLDKLERELDQTIPTPPACPDSFDVMLGVLQDWLERNDKLDPGRKQIAFCRFTCPGAVKDGEVSPEVYREFIAFLKRSYGPSLWPWPLSQDQHGRLRHKGEGSETFDYGLREVR